MKIVHVTPVFAPAWHFGGTVRAIYSLTTALAASGHSVDVVTTTVGTSYQKTQREHETVIDGVRVTYVPGRLRWGGTVAMTFASVVMARALGSDAVHISSGWQPAFRGVFAGLIAKRNAYIYSPHGCFSPAVFAKGKLKKAVYYRLFERRHLRSAAAVVATSELEAAGLGDLDSSLRVRVLPNICDPHLWRPSPADAMAWRQQHAIGEDEVLVLQVCRPDRIKNTAFLVDVMRGMPADRRYALAVIGPGQTAAREVVDLPRHVRVLRVEGSADVAELRSAYSAAEIVAVPSIYECFGNVVVEAALCGTRIIASPFVGVAHMRELAPFIRLAPLTRDDWQQAIWAAVHSPLSVPIAGVVDLTKTFSPTNVAKRFASLYNHIKSSTGAQCD